MGRRAKPAKARRPLARTSPTDEGRKVRDLEKRLAEALKREAEALEQQTATGEILRIISESPTDVQPVFDAIVRRAVRLIDGLFGALFRFDGTLIHFAAHDGFTPEGLTTARHAFPLRPTLEIPIGRTILEGSVVHVPDAEAERGLLLQRALGLRSYLSVPMLRDGVCIGGIAVARALEGPFSDRHIELFKTFADQAVIAIENVRLFNETKEALERQTATSEILRVVSQSHTEVRTVFDAIADNAMRLFRASAVSVYRVEDDGFKAAAVRGGLPGSDQAVLKHASWPMDRETPAGRCMVDRTPVHISDIKSDPIGAQMAAEGQTLRDFAHSRGWRSSLVVPILHDNGPIGAISVARAETGSFTSAEIELLQTFADQARIAIENARLLSELQARTRQLTRSVEQLTALREIGTR